MILHFIDTSAFLKLFIAEKGSDQMLTFVANEGQTGTVVSALLHVEARSAIVRLRDAHRMTQQECISTLQAVAQELQRVTRQPLNAAVLEAAGVLAERYSLRALDSLQLASALIARDSFASPEMRFVASDQALLKAAQGEHFAIWDPAA